MVVRAVVVVEASHELLPCVRRNLGGEREALLNVGLILTLDSIDCSITALFLVVLDISERFLVHVRRHGSRLNLTLDLFGRRDHLRFRLCQVKGLEFGAFRLFLLLHSAV